MKANELRIGNFINHIDCERLGLTHKEVFHLNNASYEDIINYFSSELYQPIPLTKEWLVRLGFEFYPHNNHSLFITINDSTRLVVSLDGSCRLWRFWEVLWEEQFIYFPITIKHIHTLQNLFHFLTGEELQLR